jgi:hypothetical protein
MYAHIRPRPSRQRKRLRGVGAEADARFLWPRTLALSALAPSGTGLQALVPNGRSGARDRFDQPS